MWNLAIHTLVTMVVKNSKTVFSQGNMRKKKEGKERTEEGRKKERSALLNSQDQMQMILL